MTAKQERFIVEYLKDLNASQAARRAGYKNPDQLGYQLLQKTSVSREIVRRKEKQLAKREVNADRIIDELSRIAFCNVLNYYDDEGNLRPISELREECGPEIANLETIIKNAAVGDGKTDRVLKLRTWDKPKALEVLAKHLGLLTEKVEHQHVHIHVEVESKLTHARQIAATAE